jgi:hypothetical protein
MDNHNKKSAVKEIIEILTNENIIGMPEEDEEDSA